MSYTGDTGHGTNITSTPPLPNNDGDSTVEIADIDLENDMQEQSHHSTADKVRHSNTVDSVVQRDCSLQDHPVLHHPKDLEAGHPSVVLLYYTDYDEASSC